MKKVHYLLLLILAGGLFSACSKESDLVYESDFQKSYENWQRFRDSSGNSYRYQVVTGSWTGTASETIITVQSGHVTQRSYKFKVREQITNTIVVKEEWHEDASNLKSHTAGAAAMTLDEVYDRAKNEWLKKRQDAKTYFEAKNNGLISSCGYVNDNCADDCFTGISIDFIEGL